MASTPKAKSSASAMAPFVSATVLLRTREAINGALEHAAIVTCVHPDESINAMVFPAVGLPYPVAQIRHADAVAEGQVCWSWPPKVRII